MLVNSERWGEIVSEMGINNDDHIVIYDQSDVISACRCWYNFIYFGHKPELVKVLNGGLRKWKSENRQISQETKEIIKSKYKVNELKALVKNKEQIDKNIQKNEFKLIDARSIERFNGKVNKRTKS